MPLELGEQPRLRVSEQAGRLIDGDRADSMEAKKRAGYFSATRVAGLTLHLR